MAEPPAPAPAGATVSERDVLLATKLHVPVRNRGLWPVLVWCGRSARRWPGSSSWCVLRPVRRAQGNLDAAAATYRQALEAADDSSQAAQTGLAHVGLAQVLYERNELTAALDHATRESRCPGSLATPRRWPSAWRS